ncbi:MAG: hypothetical protein IID35_08555, partial [Planctomycetes bacterium]|nr:hypothetical protein [Planctomycetota bacterium]
MNMFKKSCWGLSAVAITAGVLVWGSSLFARPPGVRPGSTISAEGPGAPDGVLDPGLFASTPATGPVCESTGFEAVEGTCGWETGWICGTTFTSCVADGDIPGNQCTGSNAVDENCCAQNTNPLNGWYVSISSQHCFEPHVDTANPASGTQHLRFQRDPSGGVTCESLFGPCRDSAFTPTVGAQPITPSLISFDLSLSEIDAPGIDGELNYFTVSDAETNDRGTNFFWPGYNGYVYVYDWGLGQYKFTSYYLTAGRYAHFEVAIDPCSGVVNYTMDGSLIYSHNFDNFSFTVERMLMTHNNGGTATWDFDNYSVVRGEVCPTECGNLEIEPPEECEEGFDECCPGLWIAEGDPGECTCPRPNSLLTCEPQVLDNGANGPFLTHGGFFVYTPDTPFTSVDTCGSDYDTEILWDINPECTDHQVYNDECTPHDFGGGQTPGDPSAPCYDETGGFSGASCICQPTTPGVPVTFVVDAYYFSIIPPVCSNTIVNINKKFECGVPVAGGACCDLV